MEIAGGVFGSGASCDAGDVRLVTLDHFGAAASGGGQPEQVTDTVTSIQRADQVRLIETHVRLPASLMLPTRIRQLPIP